MQATIGIIDKRINSTKSTFTQSSVHDVKLKNPCSRENPKLLVTGAPMQKANYMSFNGAFYYIDDIVSETNNMYTVSAHIDDLATYKSDIVGTPAFINFGPKSLNLMQLNDPRFTSDLCVSYDEVTETFDFLDYTSGCVIMRILDMHVDSGDPDGGISTICGSISDFNQLLRDYASGLSGDLDNLADDFEKLTGKLAGLGNALDSIKSAIWVPYKLSDIQAGGYSGNIGGYDISGTWYWTKYWAGALSEEKLVQINLSQFVGTHPWLKSTQYLHLGMSTPGGVSDISNNSLATVSAAWLAISCRACYDIDGNVLLVVKDANVNEVLAVQEWNCSVNLIDYVYKEKSTFEAGISLGTKVGVGAVAGMAVAGGAVSAVGTLVGEAGLAKGSATALGAGVGMMDLGAGMDVSNKALATGIMGIAAGVNMNDGAKGFGAPNNVTCLYMNDDKVTIRFHIMQYLPRIIYEEKYEDFCSRYGYPVFNYGTLGSGYYQCAGASCSAKAPAHAIAAINSVINSGIYIE